MSRKTRIRRVTETVQTVEGPKVVVTETEEPETAEPPPTETPPALAGDWWTRMTLADFKKKIATATYAQCATFLVPIQTAVRETTLRPHVESMTAEQQKIAPRMAAIHRGCAEALLTRMHQVPVSDR